MGDAARLRVAQIGTGAWGRRWAAVLAGAGTDVVELVALADTDRGAAEHTAHAIGAAVPCFDSVAALARAGLGLDAVIVAVPVEHHSAVVCDGLAGGWHCLVEKPVADSVAAARAMAAAAAASDRTVMVAHNYRFGPVAGAARQLVADGRVGPVGQVLVDYRADMPFDGFMVEIEEPLIGRYYVHHLDLCRWVLGTEFPRVRARSWNPPWSRFAGNASALLELESADRAVVVHRGSWCAPGRPTQWEGSWTIDGPRGSIDWRDDTLTLRPSHPFETVDVPGAAHRGDRLELVIPPPTRPQLARVLDRFVAAVRAGVPAEPGIEDGLGTLELLLAALVSARAGGGWVDVADASATVALGPRGLLDAPV